MIETVLEHGFDGDWFLRAYDAFGTRSAAKSVQREILTAAWNYVAISQAILGIDYG